VVLGLIGLAFTISFATSRGYKKGLVVIPLVASSLCLVLGILSLSFYGGVHANAYVAESGSNAKLGPSWVMELVSVGERERERAGKGRLT
jgi:hypothetical protein